MDAMMTPHTFQSKARKKGTDASGARYERRRVCPFFGQDGGFALIGAIGMLALFALLGTAYVKYMMVEFEDTRRHLDEIRAQHLASGGIYAAMGELGPALENGAIPEKGYTIKGNAYRYEGGGRVEYEQEIQVSVSDESGRININHAPPELLAAFGMDAEAIGKLKEAIPTPTGLRSGSRRWLNSVDDLLTRKIVNRRQFDAIQTGLLTTYTVEDHSNPARFLNLNAADLDVLAAIFGISDPGEVSQLMAKRPFLDWQDAVTKSGRESSTFNVKPPRYASREMPRELDLVSRCFRLHSEVSMSFRGIARRSVAASVEAVVLFKEDGSFAIRFWNEGPLRLAQSDEGAPEASEASGAGASPETLPAAEEAALADESEDETNETTP